MKNNEIKYNATTEDRRRFLKIGGASATTLLAGSAGMGALITSNAATAQGSGYAEINPPQQTVAPEGKIEVLEYFWFGCPHCYAFEPVINEWAADIPEDVAFIREAPPLNPAWKPHSEAYYAAEQLGVTEKFFDPMFNGIHAEKKRLRSRKEIAGFAGDLGIDSREFLGAMKSFAVETRIRQAMQRAIASGINGVPSIVIAGKYRTGNSLAGGHEGIIRVINELVESERQKG